MKKNCLSFVLTLASCVLIPFSSCVPELTPPKPDAGDADFSKVIAIGGDYMAGYQNGALFKKGQRLCIPALLAEQFKLVGGIAFNQALMPDENGIGLNDKVWENWFVTPSHLGYKSDCKGVSSLFPLRDSISMLAAVPYISGVAGNSIQNLSVPFGNIADYFNPAVGNSFSTTTNKNPFFNRIAGTPGTSTVFSDAKDQHASFVMAWVGMEDIYNFASSGGTSGSIPSSGTFAMYLDSLLHGLTANGAKGVLATIPDFKSFPYYTLVAWDNADVTQSQADSLNDTYTSSGLPQIHFNLGKNGFVIDDATAPGGFRQMHAGEYMTLSVPLDSMKCYKYGLLVNTINDRYVLDSSEVYEIDQAISSYNSVIIQKAAQYNFALADMHDYFNTVKAGIKWDGVDLNADFVIGGFYSLDGYHPNQKGYALIANEFIKAINAKYNAVIPTINCVECEGIRFP